MRHTRHTRLLGNYFIAFTCHKSSAMASSPSLTLLLLLLLLLLPFIPGAKPPAGIVYDDGEADAEKMSPCVLDKDGSRPPATDVPVAGMPGRRRRDGCCCRPAERTSERMESNSYMFCRTSSVSCVAEYGKGGLIRNAQRIWPLFTSVSLPLPRTRTLENCVSCVALVNCSRAVFSKATILPVPRPTMRASWGTSFLPREGE